MFVDFQYVTSHPDGGTVLLENTLRSVMNLVNCAYILKEEWPWQELHRKTAPQAKLELVDNETNRMDRAHGENKKMSIHDFRSKFVSGGERNVLFVALRKLSLLEDPRSLFASAEEEAGWPIWDESGEEVPFAGGAHA